jgi:exonuclease I
MKKAKFSTIIFVLLFITAIPAESLTNKFRRGSTYTSEAVQITNISSQRLQDKDTGSVKYSFEAKVRNQKNHPIKITIGFQAIDRDGYEIKEIYFSKKFINRKGTGLFSNRYRMDVLDYERIWEWKIKDLRFH